MRREVTGRGEGEFFDEVKDYLQRSPAQGAG